MLQNFLGVFVNTGAVLIGGLLGLFLKKGISKKYNDMIMSALGLCIIAIAIGGILKGQNQLVMVVSMVLGSIIGTLLDLDGKINRFGDKLNEKFNKGDNKISISEGFVTASLVFCVGAMTIIGSITAGVSGDNHTLYVKSLLDFISSIMLSVSLGIGVMFSAVFVLIFQGLLVFLSIFLGSFLSDFAIAEIICSGSLMIMAIGLNFLGLTKIKVANLMPALVLVPFVCMGAELLPL